jgi:acid phosphatase
MPVTRRSAIAIFALILCVGCHASIPPGPVPCPTVPQLRLPDVQAQIATYIDSGRYDADVAGVVDTARAWLEQQAPSAPQPAIVLDIDETSLSNWAAYRVNGWARILGGPCDLERGPCGIRAWQAMGRPASRRRSRWCSARELGVAVSSSLAGRSCAGRERNGEQGYTDCVIPLPPGRI